MEIRSSKKLFAVGAVVAFIITLILVGGLAAVLITLSSNSSNSRLNDSDLRAISEFINFSDTKTSNFLYQSPLYDFSETIDTTKYDYSETISGLSVSTKDFDQQVYITAEENTDNLNLNEAVTEFEKYNSYLDSYVLGQKEDIHIDKVAAKKITFTYKNYTGDTITVVSAIVPTTDYVYTIQYTNYDDETPNLELFIAMVTGFKFIDSSAVSDTARYESMLWGYSYSYDAKYWVLNHTDYSSNLFQRVYSSDPEDEINIDFTSSEIMRTDLAGNEASYLQSQFEKEVGEIATSTYHHNVITQTGQIDIAGRTAKYVDYTVEDAGNYSPKYHKDIFFVHYNALTKIAAEYGSESLLPELDKVLTTFTIEEPSLGFIKGISTTTGTDERVAMLSKPAVVQIFFQKCGELYVPKEADYPNTTGKSYNVCAAATGSGFFVNSTGYIATNGHVVSMDSSTFKENALSKKLLFNLFRDLVLPELQKVDPVEYSSLTDDEILTFLQSNPRSLSDLLSMNQYFMDLAYSMMEITDTVYVQKGVSAIETDEDTPSLANIDEFLKAEIIAIDFDPEALDQTEETSSDVALLKVEDGDYPILSLGSNEFTIAGTQIMAVGFPGAADALSFIDTELESQETFTKGVVSRIVDTTGDRKLIQIDASINHGNSGGPLISIESDTVLGLVTYGVNSGSSDFNFARDVADLKVLMEDNSVENTKGVTQQKIDEGIAYFFEGYYSKAVTSLEAAVIAYPDVEGLDKIIALAKDKIAQGLDKKEEVKSNDVFAFFNNMSDTEKMLFVVVAVLICVVIFMFFAIVVVFFKIRKNKTNVQPAIQPPVQPAVQNIAAP